VDSKSLNSTVALSTPQLSLLLVSFTHGDMEVRVGSVMEMRPIKPNPKLSGALLEFQLVKLPPGASTLWLLLVLPLSLLLVCLWHNQPRTSRNSLRLLDGLGNALLGDATNQ
jgi:hypothetical protein